MPIRRYLTDMIGSGVGADRYRSVLRDLLPMSVAVGIIDGRSDAQVPAGKVLAEADVTDAQHAALIADARVAPLEIEDAAGVPLADETLLSAVPLAKRTRVRNLLLGQHTPVADFTAATTVGDVRRRLRWRFYLRQILRRDDYDEGLTMTLGAIPEGKRARIRLRLWEAGFDVSVLRLTDTVEEALLKLFAQLAARETAPLGHAAPVAPTKTKRSSNGRKRKR